MSVQNMNSYTAFAGNRHIASGPLADVALKAKKQADQADSTPILVFNDDTSQTVELDLRGSDDDVLRRLAPLKQGEMEKARPGRPKLGVVCREISLLPRHWEWLRSQPGGASVTLRKLVDEAKKKSLGRDAIRLTQEVTYKFMSVMAGDLPGYEEALRALYAIDAKKFNDLIAQWPKDIREHTQKLATPIFI